MDNKKLFEAALSAKMSDYPFSDTKTVMNNIMERAEKMKNHENAKQMKFTEITPEYIKPKKSHKAISVVAGIAGTAAVLTGAVFGLNWLSEHGGLKGPDVQGAGAGAAETTEMVPSDSKDILQSGYDVLEFSDMTATIHKIDYDGQFLRMLVEAEYDEPLSNNQLYLDVKDSAKYDMGEYCLTDHQFILAADYQDVADKIWDEHIGVTPWDDSADIIRVGNKLMYDLGIYIRLDPGQTAEVRFLYFPDAESADSEYAGNYTLTGIDTTGAFYTASDSAANTTVTVSKWGALIESPNNYGEDDVFSVAVKYKDGTEQILADRDVQFKFVNDSDEIPFYEFPAYYYQRKHGRDYLMESAFRGEKIDVANIAGVVINGREICADPNADRESITTSGDDSREGEKELPDITGLNIRWNEMTEEQ